MGMIFGIHFGPQNTDIDQLRRLWTYADRNGFAWASTWDHFYCKTDDSAPHFEAVALMAAMACETSNVDVGCLVFGVGYRNPAVLLKSMVTVDHLSGGRAQFGLGAGWHEPEYRAYGIPYPPVKARMDNLEEAARAVKLLMNQETSDFDGEHVRLANAYSNPKPVNGALPLWIGGGGEKRTLRIAARYADGWNVPYLGPEVVKHKSSVLDMWCEKEGRDPSTIVRSVNVGFYMGADEAGVSRAWERMLDQLGPGAADDYDGQLVGTPARAIERIGEYRDAGIERVNIAFRPPIDFDALQAFVEEVMPAFR
jgi:alkanesulfonate monooxygenase SsuD/methylene tetrahydromethanopterin reductase-like flavin-dependent oxidoreductase (luciferase family)